MCKMSYFAAIFCFTPRNSGTWKNTKNAKNIFLLLSSTTLLCLCIISRRIASREQESEGTKSIEN